MTANRLAALSAAVTGLAAFVAGLVQVLPGGAWPNVALAGAGLLTKLGAVLSFLDGSKKFDALEVERMLGVYNATGSLAGRSQGVKATGFDPVIEP